MKEGKGRQGFVLDDAETSHPLLLTAIIWGRSVEIAELISVLLY